MNDMLDMKHKEEKKKKRKAPPLTWMINPMDLPRSIRLSDPKVWCSRKISHETEPLIQSNGLKIEDILSEILDWALGSWFSGRCGHI